MLERLPASVFGLMVSLCAVLTPSSRTSARACEVRVNAPTRAALPFRVFPTPLWLIFAAFCSRWLREIGLGKRIASPVKAMVRNTLTLGYAIVAASPARARHAFDTARSGVTIYPILRNIPALYDSQPTIPRRG